MAKKLEMLVVDLVRLNLFILESFAFLMRNAWVRAALAVIAALLCGFSLGVALKMFFRGNLIISFFFLGIALVKASAFWYLIVRFR